MIQPCPLIEVEGPPHERGLQYGRLGGERIQLGAARYLEQLKRDAFDADALQQAVQRLLPVMAGFDALYMDEMRGIAEGADCPFEHIVLLNARTELLQLARRQRAAGAPDHEDDPDGCTGVVVLPAAARDGRLIHAQNWDWKAECADTAVVLKVHGIDGAPDFMTFTEAGGLARCGMNAAGIAITANYLECDRDYQQLGVPLALFRRKVLEQRRLAHALRAVYCTPKSASNNMMVSHAEGVVVNFECAPDETFLVQAQDGLLVHANHWLSPVALGKLRDTGIDSTPDSLYRDQRVRGLLSALGRPISRADVKAALFDSFEGDWAVCRPPRPSLRNNLSATVAMIVMEPATGTMDVAMLPALNRSFQRFTLDSTFVPTAAITLHED